MRIINAPNAQYLLDNMRKRAYYEFMDRDEKAKLGKDPLLERVDEVIDAIGDRTVFRGLFDLGMATSICEKISGKRYFSRLRGTNRNLVEAYLASASSKPPKAS